MVRIDVGTLDSGQWVQSDDWALRESLLAL